MGDKTMDEDVNMLPRKEQKKYNLRPRRITPEPFNPITIIDNRKRKAETDLEEYSESLNEEKDFTLMKESISKNIIEIAHKKMKLDISEGAPDILSEVVNIGINNAFETFSTIMMDEIEDLGNDDTEYEAFLGSSWKLGLSKDEIEKYKEILKEFYNKKTVTIKDILESSLNKDEKFSAISVYNILQNTDTDSPEYFLIKKRLENIIHNAKKYTYTIDENNFKQVEDRLRNIISIHKSLKIRILEAPIEDSKKSFIYEKYLQLESIDQDSVTASSIREWIEHALKIPFSNSSDFFCKPKEEIPSILINIKKGLDEKLYGMEDVKEQLLCIFNNRLMNPQATGLAIGMVGSPGVGKTQIAKCLAEILSLPFSQISLGGMVDSSLLDGQHPGWVGSSPGMIVKNLQQMKICNGIVLFDEIDKLGDTQHGKEVQYSLLHITDPVQNKDYHDNYIGPELSIDLSKMIFIYALNKTDGLDPALLSRLPIINVPDYKVQQKVEILKSYVLPSLLKNVGLDKNDIKLESKEAEYLINKVERIKGKEGGIRGIKDGLGVIVNKINVLLNIPQEQQTVLKLTFAESLEKPVNITTSLVDNLYKADTMDDQSYQLMYA